MDEMLDTKMKTKNTTLSEQFENPIEKNSFFLTVRNFRSPHQAFPAH